MAGAATRSFGNDPLDHFNRFQDRQLRTEQFTEDIRKLMGGSVAPSAHTRTRSPGLKAGAALALGGGGGAASLGASAGNRSGATLDVTLEAHAQRLQAVDRSRHFESPFDDHRAFGASAVDRCSQPRLPPPAPASGQASRSMGKQIRELQQKVGAGAPWDAPETTGCAMSSSAAAAAGGLAGGRGSAACREGSPFRTRAYLEAQSEATHNKSRMMGAKDLLGGYGPGGEAPNRQACPVPKAPLLPEAQMNVVYHGGSAAALSSEKVAYLNSKVLAEANRGRNETNRMSSILLG